jgi:hypothetical protein
MFTLRCTQKLLRRGLVISPLPDEPPSTSLGDWYANILYVRPHQIILCASAKTLLPIIVTAKEARDATSRLAEALGVVLRALDIPGPRVTRELALMGECRIGRTADRRVIGSLNELAFLLEHQIHHHRQHSITEHALRLAETPMKFIGYASPDRATQSLFSTEGGSNQLAGSSRHE